MNWYAIEPLVPHKVRQAIDVLPQAKIPLVRQYMTRRIVTVYDEAGGEGSSAAWVLDELLAQAAKSPSWTVQADILSGIGDAFRGRRGLKPPPAWKEPTPAVSTDRQVKQRTDDWQSCGDEKQSNCSCHVADAATWAASATGPARRSPRPGSARCSVLARTASELRPEIIRTLAGYEQPDIPVRLVELYPRLTPAEQQDAIQTMTARPAFALSLLDAIEQKKIPRQDISALIIRQLLALEQTPVTDRLRAVWGEIRPPAADKKERIEQFKSQLTADVLKSADVANGRAIFSTKCASATSC
jgi:hypothetical protein